MKTEKEKARVSKLLSNLKSGGDSLSDFDILMFTDEMSQTLSLQAADLKRTITELQEANS